MPSDINRTEITGRVGQDPQVNYTQSGTAVANMNVAVRKDWTDKNTGQKQEKTTWFRVVWWGRVAEVMAQYCGKGSALFVAGPMEQSPFTDKNGVEREGWQINGQDFRIFDSRPPQGQQPQQQPQQPQGQQQPQPQPQPQPQSGAPTEPQDIPF